MLVLGKDNAAGKINQGTHELHVDIEHPLSEPTPNSNGSNVLHKSKGLGQWLRPIGPGPDGSDSNLFERIVNVATCLPYGLVGWHAIQERKTLDGKIWGASLIAVSAGAAAFHASPHGNTRCITRKLDYWLIAASTVALSRAVFPSQNPAYGLLSLAATPFQPFQISSANILAVESEFYNARNNTPELRKWHHRHSAAAAIGAACFFLEDYKANIPCIHAAWHCLSAYATATTNHLLAELEQRPTEKKI